MITVRPKLIRFLTRGFARAITLYPFIILKKEEYRNNHVLINHERIHLAQQAELLVVLFYLWYLIEFLVRWVITQDRMAAYVNICFEREAYRNQHDLNYLEKRRQFSFIKYLRDENTRQDKNFRPSYQN